MSRQQAEALTEHLTEVLCSHKEKLTEGFVSKTLLERVSAQSHCLLGLQLDATSWWCCANIGSASCVTRATTHAGSLPALRVWRTARA